MNPLEMVLKEIDNFNKNDLKTEVFEGEMQPSELIYSIRVSSWVKQLNEKPSEVLQIAARGAHIGRWEIPRENYPLGKSGYFQWKSFLLQYHAKKVAGIMQANGYGNESIQKVSDIIMRKKLKVNPDTQTLEDAVSLVFLEVQLLPLMAKATEEKVLNAIVKTWAKMSTAGHQKALQLRLPPEAMKIIQKALKI